MQAAATELSEGEFPVLANRTWAIFLISVVGLFLEMTLIRWLGTEVRIFAYLQNTILIVCFVGLGLGCFTSRQPVRLRQSLIPLALLALLLAIPVSRQGVGKISEMLSLLSDFVIWHYAASTNPWLTLLFVVIGLAATYALMILLIDVFVPIGRLLGRLMDEHPNPIAAYSANIGGSLVGAGLPVLLSLFYQPPAAWFAVLAVLLLAFVGAANNGWRFKGSRGINLVLLAAVVVLAWFAGLVPGSLAVVWSPYQKLVVIPTEADAGSSAVGNVGKYVVTVNNTGYQTMIDLSEANVAAHPDQFPPELRGMSQYDIPLLLHPHPQTFLVVGAGAGNDAAGGLRHGVPDITAVEIDPAIIDLGRRIHPENPYAAPSVHVVNDDARSFFATTQQKFDVIAFSLLDSHTTTAMTNARLDHYVYTRESILRAKSLLAPHGVMVLSFEVQKPFIADRMAAVLRDVFDQEPLVFRMPGSGYGWGGVMFVTGDLATVRRQIQADPRLAWLIEYLQREYPVRLSYTTRVATDDWPYIYLESPRIPVLFFLLSGLLVLVVWRSYRRWQARGVIGRWDRSYSHFFFLGAAFLLLEVQNISKASVVLGNTWQVNAVIVSGVLTMALLANLLARRFPTFPLRPVYGLLVGTCLALYFVDLAQFAFLPYVTKAIVIGSLTALPMLFSGVIFIRSFAAVTGRDQALGANMVGSLVGALLQSMTFVVGIKALLLVVAALYLLAWATRPGPVPRSAGVPEPA